MPETYPDIPRPGDPDFTTFPKHLPEDCIQYTVHILTNPLVSPSALRSRLLQFQSAATNICKTLLRDYIWQREGFALALVNASEGAAGKNDSSVPPWHLAGSTAFGDSVADEWLIVYLLRELSSKFKDAWIRVVDGDGEFLLVEAANTLPKWLNPEVADHRVWINDEQLRIIPRGVKAMPSATHDLAHQLPRHLSLAAALSYISRSTSSLIHSPIIEAEAFYRLRNYPAAIRESLHTALVTIPRNLAYILHRTPAHISPAVDAFYLRDPISLRPLRAKTSQKLRFPPRDMVTVSVTFTRVGYAQMKSQEFPPPEAWVGVVKKAGGECAISEMGMKVACGFEMLVADPQNCDKRAVREIQIILEDVESGEEELPLDSEIKEWPRNEDDEKWLDVDFDDFEKELDGKGRKRGEKEGPTKGFGDKAAQDNLRRMVERFEQFLNDDDAGVEGADFSDDMDYDNDDEDEDSAEDPEEDRDASFDEEEFAQMMKQMMGLPPGDGNPSGDVAGGTSRIEEVGIDSGSEEDEDLEEVMQRMEAELREAGALDLEPSGGVKDAATEDPGYLMAKNLLESFEGQVGASGPTGNLMSSLGYRPQRDQDR